MDNALNDSEIRLVVNKHFAEAATIFDMEYLELRFDNSDLISCIKTPRSHF